MHTLITLLLATLASSHPTRRQETPSNSRSTGFHLVARLTRPAGDNIIDGGVPDLFPGFDNKPFVAIHTGAALSQAVIGSGSATDSRTYYLNGTQEQWDAGTTNILSDGGTPPFPWGIGISPSPSAEGEQLVTVNGGSGTPTTIAKGEAPYVVNSAAKGTFVACNRLVPYYNTNYTVVGYVSATDEGGRDKYVIPEACAIIQLVPLCAELEGLPEGSLSDHDHALEVGCY